LIILLTITNHDLNILKNQLLPEIAAVSAVLVDADRNPTLTSTEPTASHQSPATAVMS